MAVLRSGWVSPPPVFWIFMDQGKIMEAEVPTVRVGATPTGLTVPPPPQPPRFLQAGCLPATQPTASKHRYKINKILYVYVLFCSLAILDPRVGYTIDILSPFVPVLCHSD